VRYVSYKVNPDFAIIFAILIGFVIGELETLLNPALLLYSEQFNYLVLHGYFYEIMTSIFITNNFLDFAFNEFSMYVIYLLFRSKAGSLEFLVFLLGGIVGNVFSLLYYPPFTLSAGASGGIFALLAYYLVYDLLHEKELGRYGLVYLLFVFVISDFVFPDVDILAHLGGIVCGITLAIANSLKRNST